MNATTLPESAAVAAANPLLDFTDLPLFDAIRPEHVEPAIAQLQQAAEQALETVVAADYPAEWEAMARVLDVATERLGRAWGAVSHLNSVADTPELRAAYNAVLPAITEFWTRMGADERLYAKYKAMDPERLTPEQAQARTNALRGFVLGAPSCRSRTRSASPRSRNARPSWARSSARTRSTRPTPGVITPAPTSSTVCRPIPWQPPAPPPKPRARTATSSRSSCPATCR